MSGSGLPYRLRPNKFVDRELFAELISLLAAERDSNAYAYISMGGNHLSDHLAVYRRAGLRKLYAFDNDDQVVDRQKFNAPFDGLICETHRSSELPTRIDSIIQSLDVDNVIIWLDFTEAKHLEQLGEIQALCRSLRSGDVLRVTMNIDFRTLHKRESQLSAIENKLPVDEKRAALMKRALGAYMPRKIKKVRGGEDAATVAESIARACELGIEEGSITLVPCPILITEYQDSSKMVSVTLILADEDHPEPVPAGWNFKPSNWSDVERIVAPDLSPREKFALEKEMHMDPDMVSSKLGFKLDADAIKAYARFHRFYPSFQMVAD